MENKDNDINEIDVYVKEIRNKLIEESNAALAKIKQMSSEDLKKYIDDNKKSTNLIVEGSKYSNHISITEGIFFSSILELRKTLDDVIYWIDNANKNTSDSTGVTNSTSTTDDDDEL